MEKIALFGGSFDPIHPGHIRLARRLADALELERVILMPTFVPPHKIRERMAPAADRLAMCRLAAAADSRLTVSDWEIRRGGASFTADTLAALQETYPDARLYLITGADMFCTLHTWYHFADIARMAVLCTVPRPGISRQALAAYAARLRREGAECYVDAGAEMGDSSTEIRRRIAAGESLTGLLDPAVEDYIRQHHLYREETSMENTTRDEQFRMIIRSRLSDYRYHHSLCVADEARRLAQRYGADPAKAYTAGLLHDIMKDTDGKIQLQILKDFAILLTDVERAVPQLWHAVSGAAFVEHILELTDAEILTAIRYHTTGRAGMSLLERVLFVADFTSADREYPDVAEMRRRAEESLESAMLYGISYTVRELLERGNPIHPDTVAAYNEIVLAQRAAQGGLSDEK